MNPQQPVPYIGSKTECKEQPIAFPPQHQSCQPGLESLMSPRPISEDANQLQQCNIHHRRLSADSAERQCSCNNDDDSRYYQAEWTDPIIKFADNRRCCRHDDRARQHDQPRIHRG